MDEGKTQEQSGKGAPKEVLGEGRWSPERVTEAALVPYRTALPMPW